LDEKLNKVPVNVSRFRKKRQEKFLQEPIIKTLFNNCLQRLSPLYCLWKKSIDMNPKLGYKFKHSIKTSKRWFRSKVSLENTY